MLDADGDAPVLLRRSTAQPIDPGYVSMPQPIAYATPDGLTAHAFFYPPRNRDFVGPADSTPQRIVQRSEVRRVGNEWCSTCTDRWAHDPKKKKKPNQ